MKLKTYGQNDEVTYYELTHILKAIEDTFKDVPLQMHNRVTEEEKYATESLINSITAMNNRVAEFDAQWAALEQKLTDETEQYWKKVDRAHRDLNEKIRRLTPVVKLDINTYELEKILDIVNKCDNLTEKQWNMVLQLVKAAKND